MSLRKLVLAIALIVSVISPIFSQQEARKPAYKKSNPSKRFLKYGVREVQNLSQHNPFKPEFYANLPDTLNVMAIRVQFQKDSDRNTTGNGWFDLTTPDSLILNPPPHDSNYFANQLRALKDYWKNVSKRKLILNIQDELGNYAVFPQQADSVWTLGQKMDYYNPNTTEDELDQRLVELFRDAIQIADQNSDITFSDYDVYIIYHAGVGAEFTQDLDTTPNDIPSVFLNFSDLKRTIGQNEADFEGIEVNNGAFRIKEGIILPETENQSGYEFGMLGTAAIMFGHQLGLPNLFNTDTGRPGIGIFGVMDQGSGSFSGFIPVQPCAWSKIFLGWEEAIEVTDGDNIPVAASLAKNQHKIYKIPINAHEYFLIENRQRSVLKSRAVAIGYDEYGSRIEFTDDGEIILPPGTNRIGVIVQIDEYDFGLPGSGMLIWHIDENVINQHFEENRVNADMDHRGVDVVEADGAQDIGHFYNFFGITGYDPGGLYDMWWDENGDHLYANSSEQVMFTPNTMPNSNAHSGAGTGIYITDFSAPDSIMYFTLRSKNAYTGFPVYLDENSGVSPLVNGDLDGDGKQEILAATENGEILAWKFTGEKYIENDDQSMIVNLNGDTTYVPLAVFAEIEDEKFSQTPSLSDLNGDQKLEVIAGSDNGLLYVWKPADNNQDGRADLLFQIDCEERITTVPVVGDFSTSEPGKEIAVGLENGNIVIITRDGDILFNKNLETSLITGMLIYQINGETGLIATTNNGSVFRLDDQAEIVWQFDLAREEYLNYPALGDLNNDGQQELIVTSRNGTVLILDSAGNMIAESNTDFPLSNPTLADVDYNGYLDIVATGDGKISAFNHTGISVTNFPLEFEKDQEQAMNPDPVIVDLDGDNLPEIIVSTSDNQLLVFDMNGKKDISFSMSGSSAVHCGVADLSNNGKVNLFARTGDDYCYAWELEFDYIEDHVLWGSYLKNAEHNGIYLEEILAPAIAASLMPVEKVYNYPNPTEGSFTTIRYYLSREADVLIKIFDLAGEFVEEIIGTGYPEIDNEVIWDISDVQSGVYLANVTAKGDSEKQTAIIKIAVIK